jgi:hypothetical protein
MRTGGGKHRFSGARSPRGPSAPALAALAAACLAACSSDPSPVVPRLEGPAASASTQKPAPKDERAARCADRYILARRDAEADAEAYAELLRKRDKEQGNPAAEGESSRRSDIALRQWVGNHIGINKLPCVLSGADYVVRLQVANRSKSPVSCTLGAVFSGDDGPPLRSQILIEVGKSAQLELAVRSCPSASPGSPKGPKIMLTCPLSDENRAEAGITSSRLRWFGYDLDSLEITSAPTREGDVQQTPLPPPPSPLPDEATFMARCLAETK